LTAALGREVAGAEVLTHSLGPSDDGTSSRRRIHLTWNDAGAQAGLPASVFCKSTMRLETRYVLVLNGGIAGETTFYNEVRPNLPIRAPEALFSRHDPATFNSIIIMRDLGGQVEFATHETTLTLAQARSQLRLLAGLHARYYDNELLAADLAVWNIWEDYFDSTMQTAFGPSCERGFRQAGDIIPAAVFARPDDVWSATLRCVDDHRRLPRTLIHSDVHLKNWYIDGDGELGLSDWQCSSKGNWSRDVSYAVATALSIDDRRAWERDLLSYYLDQLRAAGAPAPGLDDAWRLYRQQLFAALAWWTGTLGQPRKGSQMQPQDTSREFIRRITAAIDDLDALNAWD
jgi:hypothetical protein